MIPFRPTWTLLVLVLCANAGARVVVAGPPICLNTIGFQPTQPKRASIAIAATNFVLIRPTDEVVVFSGSLRGPCTNQDTGEALFTADFSAFTNAGTVQLGVPGGGRSAPFRISADLYREPFATVTRAMYLWRCGTAVACTHRGQIFSHGACHTNDAWLDYVGGNGIRSNSIGGWHDAGDYNKYVVNAGVSLGAMFRAWEDFGAAIQRVPLGLPGSGDAIPEFLAEIKWELDWLLTMQAPDGSVYHKVSTREFGPFIMPEQETARRYFAPWSSAATADFVAMTAAAARCFRPYDAEYAERCSHAAWKSYAFLQSHPDNHPADLTQFTTGGYQTQDRDERLWAAAELWETTGDPEVLADCERRIGLSRGRVETDFDWGNVGNLGLITYVLSERSGRDDRVVARIRQSLVRAADRIVQTSALHGYGRPLGTRYYWGCNGGVARQVLLLHAAFQVQSEPAYRATSVAALDYLFGRNPSGRSFVTGLGGDPPLHPHDRRSGADGVPDPWPGYLVGGPNRGALSWEDVEDNYRVNEIAINWNAALIYALAAFLVESEWEHGALAPGNGEESAASP